ncbi:hypothetical protein Vafri_8106 [Volvox africanus]|uniref:Apyrase n=1 Tax=Volvox africanus TaxID=51714 RepID=A0A8J4B1N6_9CHLO|nr:hypothetical protein Vafri_8106 [Volvox africanus]
MYSIPRIVVVMLVLSIGTTALFLGAWYTGYVAGRQVSTGRSAPWVLLHQLGSQLQWSSSNLTNPHGRPNSLKPHGRGAAAAVSGSASAAGEVPERYAVLIDAGSSGSRVHVYGYRPAIHRSHNLASGYPVVRLPGVVQRVTPGLSEFAPDGEGVAESLKPLIEFAQEKVPPPLHATTSIRLMATAGLRMLPEEQREAVLGAVRRLLAASGFRFRPKWARVISGNEEGLFAWAGINYAAGRLQALAQEQATSPRQKDPAVLAGRAAATTLAVLELGGASMQLTLMPWEPLPRGLGTILALPGVDRPLYTHSFLGYGLQVAWFREAMLVQQGGENSTDPCLYPGYTSYQSGVVGSGDFDECVVLAEQLLKVNNAATTNATTTTNATGTANSNSSTTSGCSFVRCSIGDEYLPLLAPEDRLGGYGSAALLDPVGSGSKGPGSGFHSGSGGYLIMATESFYYTMDRLGLPPNASLESLRTAGKRFCSRPWSDVERELVLGRGVSEEYILKVCFGSAYIYTLLKQGFRMGSREATYLRFSNQVERPDGSLVEVNWVLGALLVELTAKQPWEATTLKGVSEQPSAALGSEAKASTSTSTPTPTPTSAAGAVRVGARGRFLKPANTQRKSQMSSPPSALDVHAVDTDIATGVATAAVTAWGEGPKRYRGDKKQERRQKSRSGRAAADGTSAASNAGGGGGGGGGKLDEGAVEKTGQGARSAMSSRQVAAAAAVESLGRHARYSTVRPNNTAAAVSHETGSNVINDDQSHVLASGGSGGGGGGGAGTAVLRGRGVDVNPWHKGKQHRQHRQHRQQQLLPSKHVLSEASTATDTSATTPTTTPNTAATAAAAAAVSSIQETQQPAAITTQ